MPDASNLQTLLRTMYLRRTRATIGLKEPEIGLRRLELSTAESRRYKEIELACDQICAFAIEKLHREPNTDDAQSELGR